MGLEDSYYKDKKVGMEWKNGKELEGLETELFSVIQTIVLLFFFF